MLRKFSPCGPIGVDYAVDKIAWADMRMGEIFLASVLGAYRSLAAHVRVTARKSEIHRASKTKTWKISMPAASMVICVVAAIPTWIVVIAIHSARRARPQKQSGRLSDSKAKTSQVRQAATNGVSTRNCTSEFSRVIADLVNSAVIASPRCQITCSSLNIPLSV